MADWAGRFCKYCLFDESFCAYLEQACLAVATEKLDCGIRYEEQTRAEATLDGQNC